MRPRRARSLLTAAQVPFDEHMRVGAAAERIVLGSVSLKVIQLADVPVTLVK